MIKEDAKSYKASVYLRLPRTSRFLASQVFPDLGNTYGRWPFNISTIPTHDQDKFYEIQPTEEMNWQLLAFRFWGSTFLWWALPLINGSRDAFDGRPRTGETIRIPEVSRILGFFKA